MSADVTIGDGDAGRLTPHPLRAAILGEVHARPFTAIPVPSRILHFAFDTSGADVCKLTVCELRCFSAMCGPGFGPAHGTPCPARPAALPEQREQREQLVIFEPPGARGSAPHRPGTSSRQKVALP